MSPPFGSLALASLLGIGCVGQPSPEHLASERQPVVGATVSTDDPAVVALVSSTGDVSCTGTLVSPRVVVTAAHCIDKISGDPNIGIFFGDDTEGDGRRVSVADTQRHLGWTGILSGGHDIGVVLLEFPADPLIAKPLNTSPITNHIGDPYRVVGFGIHDRATRELDGKKRTGEMSIDRVIGDFLEAGDDQTTICQGDSGGPGFLTIDGVEYLAGVHSYSFEGCFNPSGDTRVDLFGADFVLPWIQANDPSCKLDGLCGPIGCIDDPDCQPCGADGTCTSGCALPDPDCPTSALGEICQANGQCMSELCVFWEADRSTHFCSMSCTPGDSSCPSGMSCQSIQPYGNICYYDDEPPGVLGSACNEPTECGAYLCVQQACTTSCNVATGQLCPQGFECTGADGGFYCLSVRTEEGGGCQLSATGGGHGWWLLLGALFAVRRRRRR